MRQRLLDGELDCVFGAITPELQSGDLLARLHAEVLLDDELCVLGAASNAFLGRRGLRWADLRHAAWVVPPRETLVRQAFMTAFLNDGVTPPEPVVEAMSSVTVGAVLRLDATLLCAVRREQAIDEIAAATRTLLDGLVTKAPPKSREAEALKGRARHEKRMEREVRIRTAVESA